MIQKEKASQMRGFFIMSLLVALREE